MDLKDSRSNSRSCFFNFGSCSRATEDTTTEDTMDSNQILLSTPQGATAQVSLLGAQVTSWCKKKGEELLFKSKKTSKEAPEAIRGGILICFPEFGNCESPEQHGFARNRMWSRDENPPPPPSNSPSPDSFVDLLLKSSEEDVKRWPHSFEFRHRVSLTTHGNLTLESRVRNINSKPFSFKFSYHTYLLVSDISEIRIEGLETLNYLDNLSEKELYTDQGDALTFESEQVDRVYLSSPNLIGVVDHEKKRTYIIRKRGLTDVVVANPGQNKSKSIFDFGEEEYKKMLCVDGAFIENPVLLKPGEEWTGSIKLTTVSSSLGFKLVDHNIRDF